MTSTNDYVFYHLNGALNKLITSKHPNVLENAMRWLNTLKEQDFPMELRPQFKELRSLTKPVPLCEWSYPDYFYCGITKCPNYCTNYMFPKLHWRKAHRAKIIIKNLYSNIVRSIDGEVYLIHEGEGMNEL